ncbi:MFS general substrate transporter [Zalerion maritima]|uniref:MFS general substrate transporter n=1 Tax=Zalerion maritima TaxID=339359 RepID=A0AAD5RQP7_9PEZI|nr:MFS general substrate transporter [Zalerion maritima]
MDPNAPKACELKVNPDGSAQEVEDIGTAEAAPLPTSAADLTQDERDFLLARHGTLELDPMPTGRADDPYNWLQRKKVINILLVSFHTFMTTFNAGAIMPAFSRIAADVGVTVPDASYLTSIQILVLGISPLLWRPLGDTYGRRPVFLASLVMSGVFNVGCALSTSYAMLIIFRLLVAFFIAPASAIGSGVVAETFFVRERPAYIGMWTVMVTLGVPIGSLIFGPVAYVASWQVVFWCLAGVNAVQTVLYFFWGPETLFMRETELATATMTTTSSAPAPAPVAAVSASTFRRKYLDFKRINPAPMVRGDFIRPARLASRMTVLLPALSYSVIFLTGSILVTLEIPQLLEEKFGINTAQLGLQYIPVVVGSLMGEQLGGFVSSRWMAFRSRGMGPGRPAPPPVRLWMYYPGALLTVAGCIIFLARAEFSTGYEVWPVVGSGIASVGNQLVTTVMMTFAVECNQDVAASVGVFVNLLRQTIGFVGPFWFPYMFDGVGVALSSVVITAIIVVFSILPAIGAQVVGNKRFS